MASSRMPQPVGVHAGDAGGAANARDDAANDVPVQRAAVAAIMRL